MKMNQSYMLRIGASVMLLVGASAARGSEAVFNRKQEHVLLHELINAPLEKFHSQIPCIERPMQCKLLSRLVKAHIRKPGVWESLIIEAKIERLIDELQGFSVPESVKAKWITLYHRANLKRFQALVEGLAKGSTVLSRVALGNSPDPRVPGNSSVHVLGSSEPVKNLTGQTAPKRLNLDPSADKDGVSWTAMLTGAALVGVGIWLYAVSSNSKNIQNESLTGALVRKYLGNMRKV